MRAELEADLLAIPQRDNVLVIPLYVTVDGLVAYPIHGTGLTQPPTSDGSPITARIVFIPNGQWHDGVRLNHKGEWEGQPTGER